MYCFGTIRFVKKLLHYIGILRLYSLVDLLLLLLAVRLSSQAVIGSILLWIGFLFLLEARHQHEYREGVPSWLAGLFFVVGLVVFGHWAEGLAFIGLSFIYSLKNGGTWGALSPIIRGLQPMALVMAVVSGPLLWWIGGLTMLRNFLGDVRDARKDKKEGLKTVPVLLGISFNAKYIHLVGVMGTTLVWWSIGGLAIWVLFLVWVIEMATYNLTPR
jgi:hypothetical protein